MPAVLTVPVSSGGLHIFRQFFNFWPVSNCSESDTNFTYSIYDKDF